MSKPQPPEELQESVAQGHEIRDARFRNVVLYGGGMLALVIIMGFVVSVILFRLMAWSSHGNPSPPQFQLPQNELPPAPRLEEHPWLDLREFRDAETRQLESYGWVDKSRGVVRIPIERAMELIVRRELPAKPAGGKTQPSSGRPEKK